MSGHADRASAWIYRGLWRGLADWMLVPRDPPTLPAADGDEPRSFRPAPGFLRYLKFWFWIVLVLIDLSLTVLWLVILVASPLAGALLAPVWLVVAIVPDIIAWIAIHLRYDTTWYVLSSRSMRIRRGIWSIREVTITYENIQNVSVTQGPIQRACGIASVTVQTAGGGGTTAGQGGGAGHSAVLEGLDDAAAVRDLIMTRVRAARSAGLGDEDGRAGASDSAGRLGPGALALLREIRDLARAAGAAAGPQPGRSGQ